VRQPIIAGNWKMFKTNLEVEEFIGQFKALAKGITHCEIVLCPPFTAISYLAQELAGTNISLGAQNMHQEEQGAYTGEISPLMLKAVGCKYVILGHSERREYFQETDEIINRKVKSALTHGLLPILCVGESIVQRDDGTTKEIIRGQVSGGLHGLTPAEVEKIILAYEPVWAIGTGKTASSQDAEEVISYIRGLLGELFGQKTTDLVRIQYGGSVKPSNASELMEMPNIDGALVGGASLDPKSFAELLKYQA
jgi:triosephosphate isomerase (TIM)